MPFPKRHDVLPILSSLWRWPSKYRGTSTLGEMSGSWRIKPMCPSELSTLLCHLEITQHWRRPGVKVKVIIFPNMRLKNHLLHSETDTEKQICSTPASSPWFSSLLCASPSPKSLWSQNTSPVTFERSPWLLDSLDKLHHYGLLAFSWILTPRKASQLPLLLAGAPTQYLSCNQGPLLSRRSITP